MSDSRTAQATLIRLKYLLAIAIVSAAPLLGAEKAKNSELWAFWFSDKGKLYNEMANTDADCKAAEAKWEKETALGPVVYRCSAVSQRLLKEAKARCRREKGLSCAWRDDIKMLIEVRAATKARK